MDAVRTRIRLIVSILMLIACAFVLSLMSSASTREQPVFDRARILEQQLTPPRATTTAPSAHTEEDVGAVDLYGNEVSDAVAKYKADSAGGIYELHSPQTEVPRLGSPKS